MSTNNTIQHGSTTGDLHRTAVEYAVDNNSYVGYRHDEPDGGEDCIVVTPDGDRLSPDRSQRVEDHSRGFEWYYAGSGPAQLALALLLDHYGDRALARAYYQRFCQRAVARLFCGIAIDDSGGRLQIWRLKPAAIERVVQEIERDFWQAGAVDAMPADRHVRVLPDRGR